MNLQKFRYIKIGAETLIYVILFGMMLIQIALPFKIYSLVSLGTWIIVISSMFAFIIRILRGVDKNMLMVIALMVIIVVSMLCSFTLSYKGFSAALSFLEIPLLICAYPEVRSGKQIRKAVYACFGLLSVFYIALSFTDLANIYYTDYGKKQMSFLTLGYNNPNETAMYLFVTIIVLSCFFMESHKLFNKISSVILIVLMVALIWRTSSRTSLVVCIFYLFMLLYYQKRKLSSYLRIISNIIPIAFFVLTIIFEESLMEIMLLGETVETGRLYIYKDFLNSLNPWRFLVGWYPYYFENLHNAILTIFSTIGVVGTGIYLGFLNIKLRYIHNSINIMSVEKFSLLGLYCIIIYMSAESAFFVSGGAFAVMFISIYLLCITDEHVSPR